MAKVGRRPSASLRKHRPATEIRKRLRHPAIAGAPVLGRPLSIKGRVIESSFRRPLVRAKVTLQDAATPAARILASAITDGRGYFAATLAPKTITVFARVELISGQQVLPATEVSLRASAAITLTVQLLQGAATPETWQTIGARMRDARLVRLNEVVSGLLDLSPGTNPFEGLDLASRYAAATALEQAFVDPTGALKGAGVPLALSLFTDDRWYQGWRRKLATQPIALAALDQARAQAMVFERIGVVDWVVDPDVIAAGDIVKAVTQFDSVYKESLSNADLSIAGSAGLADLMKVLPPSDLSRYRDYLLAIFAGPQGSSEFSGHRQKLRDRFHQTFSGNDTTPQPANQVLQGIVKKILTAAPGATYGFGIPASSIPPQGNLSDREYLDALLELAGLSKKEFALRYRLNLARPDTEMSSVVEQQIATLQGFYTDGFESVADPEAVIPAGLLGKAPFFLFFTEWVRRAGTFHAENFLEIERCVGLPMPDSLKQTFLGADEDNEANADRRWLIPLVKAESAFNEGRTRFGQMQYAMAAASYDQAAQHLGRALSHIPTSGDAAQTLASFSGPLDYWRELAIDTPEDLLTFTDYVVPNPIPKENPISPEGEFTAWIEENRDSALLYLCHFALVVLPVMQGDTALAQGDFAEAVGFYELTTRFLLGRAAEATPAGWENANYGDFTSVPEVEQSFGGPSGAVVRGAFEPLPYTAALQPDDAVLSDTDAYSYWLRELRQGFLGQIHAMERRFLKLRHAEAMLEWADTLYRADEPSAVQRAREVYKAVLFLHDSAVGVSPRWDGPFVGQYRRHDPNPAWVSQTGRATSALSQIGYGLNWHGLSESMIPTLRYRTLKEAADRFASAARSAEQDFLAYLGKIEDAIKDEILHTNMLKRARLQGQLADEQAKIADIALAQANAQVAEVEHAIEAKQKEIEDSQDFFNQFTGFIGGMVTAITDLPSGLTGKVGEGAAVAGGLSSAEGATLTGAAAGGAALAGYGLFVYAGYTSLSGLSDELSSLQGQVHALEDKALPLAKQQVAAREAELGIAKLQKQIAMADAQLAVDLMHFQSVRFLNAQLWSQLATVVKRLMRRYLALGARFAWLAERALAFEQNRTLDIVRLDYFPRKLQGLSGADLMQADLAELEASRLDGLRRMVPIRRTLSLQFDFPVQFATLKTTGRCSFATREATLRREYPGTFGHRLSRAAVGFGGAAGMPPVRGLLTNNGVSFVSREDGSRVAMVRPPESLPLGEPADERLDQETLGVFEGTGIETLWQLDVPPAGNPLGLDGLADVQLTFDLRAHHSPNLMAADFATMPATVRRFVFVSLAARDQEAIESLRNGAALVSFAVSLEAGTLPSWHTNGSIRNIVVLIAATPLPSLHATFSATGTNLQASFDVSNGVALSNLPPLTNATAESPSPLNVFAGLPATQSFELAVNPSDSPGVLFSTIKDIVVGFEYEATLTQPV